MRRSVSSNSSGLTPGLMIVIGSSRGSDLINAYMAIKRLSMEISSVCARPVMFIATPIVSQFSAAPCHVPSRSLKREYR